MLCEPGSERIGEHSFIFKESEHLVALNKNPWNNNFFLLFIALSLRRSGWIYSRYNPILQTRGGGTWHSPGSRTAGVL
jgi:hypothetical protein